MVLLAIISVPTSDKRSQKQLVQVILGNVLQVTQGVTLQVWKGKQTVMYLSRARETTVYTLPKNIPSSNHHHCSRRGRDQTGKMENVDSD
jgi:hypothetical protein